MQSVWETKDITLGIVLKKRTDWEVRVLRRNSFKDVTVIVQQGDKNRIN